MKLLQVLQSGNGQNAKGLAESCQVSRRTIFRDLETLRKAGVPLEFDSTEDRYFIPESFFLPPVNFTAEEALAILSLASDLGKEQLPFYGSARKAALKIETRLPGPLREELSDVTQSIQIKLQKHNALEEKDSCFQTLLDAITKQRVVRMDYESLTEWEKIQTKLRPYKLFFCKRSWYVVGRSSMHRDIRMFNISRILDIRMMREKYTIPKSFSLEKHLGNAWELMRSPQDYNVHIRFQPMVARNVAEVIWHKTQKAEFLKDGCLDFYAQVSGLDEIVWWVLGYGDQAEVIKPAKLRKKVADRAAKLNAIYNQQKS